MLMELSSRQAAGQLSLRWQLFGKDSLRVPLLLVLVFFLTPHVRSQSWEMRVCGQPNSLPYSNQQEAGLENEIAEIVADELDAQLSYFWLPYPFPEFRDHHLREGDCDVVVGVGEGTAGYLTTIAYYRSAPVFVYRSDSGLDIESFDDPDLEPLTIAVMGGRGAAPGGVSLARRGLADDIISMTPDHESAAPFAAPVEAVASGEADLAVVAGAVGGYFAARQEVPLTVVPVSPLIEEPFLSLVSAITMGVRLGDEELRDRLNLAISQRWDEIQSVLQAYAVPLQPLPRPVLEVGGN